jgi:DNA repair photolyase
MAKRKYIEITCKSALNPVRGMPFAWSLNPYRGCTHSCHYCYARATHTYYGMNADNDFESKIIVKTNFNDVLRRELARPSWTGEKIAIGTATDPYQPCDGRYRITRGVLELMRERQNPTSLTTKSTLILRDLDILADLSRDTDVGVHFTVTTLDPDIWRAVEPGTPPPWQRLQVMRRLVDAGVRCSVFLAPILPGITDSEMSINEVVSTAKEHGATSVWTSTLRLAPFVKEHYLDFVRVTFPELLSRYERAYPDQNAPPAYLADLQRRIDRILLHNGMEPATRPRPPQVPPQRTQEGSKQISHQLALL